MAAEALRFKLYTKAVKALVARPHSSAEIKNKLLVSCRKAELRQQSRVDPSLCIDCNTIVARVMQQLSDGDLLNDAYFAQWHVSQRNTYRPRSKLELAGELSRKGIGTELRQDALASQNDLASAARLAAGKASADDKKLLQYLARKGFSPGIVRHVVDTRHRGGVPALLSLAEDIQSKQAQGTEDAKADEETKQQ